MKIGKNLERKYMQNERKSAQKSANERKSQKCIKPIFGFRAFGEFLICVVWIK